MKRIETPFTRMLNIDLPLIAAPMFLVSNEDIVCEASEAGAIGAFPALNYRPIEKYREVLKAIRARTKKPICVNVIVNKSNTRQGEDLKWALESGVNMFITSLGNPKTVIQEAHKNGAKVFCDVTNLEHALKVQDLGADGVIAVSQGAGGHAGPVSPLVLIPWLKRELEISVVAAGGVAHGASMAACLALGADAVSVGTRFIACKEATVDQTYKQAIVDATAEDIVLTSRISGTPAAVIRTPYIEKTGLELPWITRKLKDNSYTKKYVVPLIHVLGMKALEKAAQNPTWKNVWSAGQSVGLVDEILTVREIIDKMVNEYDASVASLTKSV
jgi:nitronate monooxygenase